MNDWEVYVSSVKFFTLHHVPCGKHIVMAPILSIDNLLDEINVHVCDQSKLPIDN